MWVVPTTPAGDAYERWQGRADPAHQRLQTSPGADGRSACLRERRRRGVRCGAFVEKLYLRRRTPRADRKRRASRSSISASRCRSAVSSPTAESSGVPAKPMSACAAARRVSTRSAPSASSLILTSSPACRPSRRRNSAGRTKRPRASNRAVPRMRSMWENDSASHQGTDVGRTWPTRRLADSTGLPLPATAARAHKGHEATPEPRKSPGFSRTLDHAPGEIRTPDLRFRRPTLYPAELRALAASESRPS